MATQLATASSKKTLDFSASMPHNELIIPLGSSEFQWSRVLRGAAFLYGD
jgi:hypothetical protein